ncbi:radial spoke head 10 homolog B-like [Bacillus rossius redtenbacheri]|uniref:radial spoke head 10 homolog B-like n=1 Tax=Bacillus rossius redtenbacheri TaxID=93214 RepID=UPI002FDEFEF3
MVKACAAFGCTNRFGSCGGLSFHNWDGTKCLKQFKHTLEENVDKILDEESETQNIQKTNMLQVSGSREVESMNQSKETVVPTSELPQRTKRASLDINEESKRTSERRNKRDVNMLVGENTEDDIPNEVPTMIAEEDASKSQDAAWKVNFPDEFATIMFTNGCKYVGRISRKIMEGTGTYYMSDGSTYEGDFQDGEMSGKGRLQWPDLSWYEGELYRGHRHGVGIFVSAAAALTYMGHWRLAQKHGSGLLVYSQHQGFYDGEWVENVRQGHGVRQYASGSRYAGQWHQHCRHGFGTMTWIQHQMYRGDWSAGEMHGQGRYTWDACLNQQFVFPQASVFSGSWEQGNISGAGLLQLDGDLRIVGQWKGGVKHGSGSIVSSSGSVMTCQRLFHDDCFVAGRPLASGPGAAGHRHASCLDELSKEKTFLIYNSCTQINLDFYIELIRKEILKNPVDFSRGDELKIDCETLLQTEERKIHQVLLLAMPQLRKLYEKYATAACQEKPHFKPVMARIMLWQLYRDIGIQHRNLSIADIDKELANNPSILLQDTHNPFETIMFWQFVHCLLSLAWTLYSQENELNTLSSGFLKLLKDDLSCCWNHHTGTVLVENIHTLPLKSVYNLYCSLGVPVTARSFLLYVCSLEWSSLQHEWLEGRNTVTADGEVTHRATCRQPWEPRPGHRQEPVPEARISPAVALLCLKTLCPLVVGENHIVVNIDYPMVFIEFYEALLMCADYLHSSFIHQEMQTINHF